MRAFEGNECSVSTGPMKYEPLVPWKPESAREKLKGGLCEGPWWLRGGGAQNILDRSWILFA